MAKYGVRVNGNNNLKQPGGNGYKKDLFPPSTVIENFRNDIEGGMGRIASARGFPGVKGFVTVFGSARPLPSDANYDMAAETTCLLGKNGYGTITGGGPGIMRAGNEGASAAGAPSIGVQPHFLDRREGNIAVDMKIQETVHTMYSRKILFSANSAAIIAFPGGFGTMDELFENLKLLQIDKMKGVQVILMGSKNYWMSLLKWLEKQALARGFINAREFGMMKCAQSPKDALKIIQESTFRPVVHDPAQMTAWFEDDLKICHKHMGNLANTSASIFGSARAKAGEYYKSAKDLARRLAMQGYAVYSGGGKGIMEAVANGVLQAGVNSMGQMPALFMAKENPDASKPHHVKLNMIASRKLVLGSSDALFFYPGGYGTLDELFEFAVRVQIEDMPKVPIVTMHKQYWSQLYKWIEKYPLEMGLIDQKDMNILTMANTSREAIKMLK
ncbi:MAG: TIGR00730 family Rossman fold protein [Candidatus Micrarchaeia archaeon]